MAFEGTSGQGRTEPLPILYFSGFLYLGRRTVRATEGSVGGELAVRLMRLVPEEGVRKQGRQGLGRIGVEPLPREEGGVGGWESRRGSQRVSGC